MAETKKSCGFAMVETGFTRAKNAGNIIMKNLMDFCIGTMMVFLLGCDLMMGQHGSLGLIGKPERGMFLDFEGFDRSSFVFQLVFAPPPQHRCHRDDGHECDGLRYTERGNRSVPRHRNEHESDAQASGGHCGFKGGPGTVVAAANAALHTGEAGDGGSLSMMWWMWSDIRTGESGYDALQIPAR